MGYLRSELGSRALSAVADALDIVCLAAEQAEPDAREMLVAVVDLLADKEQSVLSQRLREEAAGRSLLALGRLLRRPVASPSRAPSARDTTGRRTMPVSAIRNAITRSGSSP